MNSEDVAGVLAQTLKYVGAFAGKTVVVKIGGSTLGSHDTTLEDLVTLQRIGLIPVVVHGGGATISTWLRRIGAEPRFAGGLRVTDPETMEVVLMTLAGKVNKELVAQVQALGGQAVGFSGIDGGLLQGRRRSETLGLVGTVTAVRLGLVHVVMASGFIPLIAPIAIGEGGEALNLNADTAAAEIAVALRAEKLVFLTDVPGIKGADGILIPQMTARRARELIEVGVISGGMVPKTEACLRGLDGVSRCHIIDGRVAHALIRELFTDSGVGTMITDGD
ncbi:MAG: acetylglutamate kinase [Chloroflexi bacterium]|nr:acetylglutamate kinase [Chloroflexota bacterium]